METSIIIAFISASASIIVAAFSFVLNKRAERKAVLQQLRVTHYQELLNALSDLAVDGTDKDMLVLPCASSIAFDSRPQKSVGDAGYYGVFEETH
jgi:hypothetical protein